MERIEGKLELSKSREYLGVEIDNVFEACNEITQAVVAGHPLELTPARIKHFNAMILRGLTLEEDVVPGECREHSAGVGRYRATPPQDCEFLLQRLL